MYVFLCAYKVSRICLFREWKANISMYNRWRKIYPILDEHAGIYEERKASEQMNWGIIICNFSLFHSTVKNENQFWTFLRCFSFYTSLFQSIFYLAGPAFKTKVMSREIIQILSAWLSGWVISVLKLTSHTTFRTSAKVFAILITSLLWHNPKALPSAHIYESEWVSERRNNRLFNNITALLERTYQREKRNIQNTQRIHGEKKTGI